MVSCVPLNGIFREFRKVERRVDSALPGKRLKLAEFLTIAGKIVSVEARHAAALRDMLNPGSRDFAGDDVVDENGLDRAMEPGAVLDMAQRYFKTPFRIAGL